MKILCQIFPSACILINKSKWERAVFLLSLWMKDSSTVPGPCDQWPYSNNNERADLRSNRSLLFYSKSTFNDLYTLFELFLYISVQQNVTQGVHYVVTPYYTVPDKKIMIMSVCVIFKCIWKSFRAPGDHNILHFTRLLYHNRENQCSKRPKLIN